jgi:hypothetical protein
VLLRITAGIKNHYVSLLVIHQTEEVEKFKAMNKYAIIGVTPFEIPDSRLVSNLKKQTAFRFSVLDIV